MSKIKNLVKFRLQIYMRGSGFMMPLIVTGIFLYMMYTIKPLNIMSSYLLSETFIFLLMVWVGLSSASGEDEMTEQLLFLRMQSPAAYYTGKVIFLLCIVLIMDIIYTGFPAVQNMLNGYDLFDRAVIPADVGNAFLLHGGSAFAGAALGGFFHPRVMKDRKLAIVLTVFLAILTVTQTPLVSHVPGIKWVLWILPPIMRPAEIYGNAVYFQWGQTAQIFGIFTLYGVLYFIVQSILCHRNKF